MPLRTSRSSAQPPERPVLAPGWLIVLMAGMVGGALWLLYPRQDLERRLTAADDSALSLAYLENLLRSDPQNPRLRLLLAQHQVGLGDLSPARATLQPALDSSDEELHSEALWTLWELNYADFLTVPASNPDLRASLRTGLKQQLHTLAQETWPREQQLRLVALTAQFNEPALGIALNRQLCRTMQAALSCICWHASPRRTKSRQKTTFRRRCAPCSRATNPSQRWRWPSAKWAIWQTTKACCSC